MKPSPMHYLGWLPTFNFKIPAFIPLFILLLRFCAPKKDIIFKSCQENTYFPTKKCNIFVTQQEIKPKEK